MNLPEFLFIPAQSTLKSGIIWQTKPPFVIGKLYLCESAEDIKFMQARTGDRLVVKMDDYNIFITAYSTLHIPNAPSENTLKQMLNYFRSEKIEARLGKYKKYLG